MGPSPSNVVGVRKPRNSLKESIRRAGGADISNAYIRPSANNTRQKAERFRILIIGNANAGKTTILEKVCHARGLRPKFLDAKNEEITLELKASAERGEHDIEHQIVYPTAHGFIFHDSRGFEAGSTSELDKVKAFIEKRAKEVHMKDRLHAIWYCLPTSNDRPLTKAEMSIFESSTGNVPIIAVFTKMDALDKKIFGEEYNKHEDVDKAKEQVPSLAKARFEQDYLAPLKEATHQPKAIVELREMNKQEKNCNNLILETANALDTQTLTLLLLTAQQNDAEFSIKQVISQHIIPLAQEVLKGGIFSEEKQKSLLHGAMVLFPHSLSNFEKKIKTMNQNAAQAMKEATGAILQGLQDFDFDFFQQDKHLPLEWTASDTQKSNLCLKYLSLLTPFEASSSDHHIGVIILGTAIIFTLLSSLFSSTASTIGSSSLEEDFFKYFQSTFEIYFSSSSLDDLVVAVEQKFQQSQNMSDGDKENLFNILMENPLFSEILQVN